MKTLYSARRIRLHGRRAPLALVALLVGVSQIAVSQAAPVISPGDLLYIDVYRRPELCSTTQVDATGNIALPYVGSVSVAGVGEDEASARLCAAMKKILRNPQVTVSRSAPRAITGGRSADMQTQLVNLNNANAEMLYEALLGMTSEGGNIGFDANTNTLIITDTPEAVQNMMSVIAQLDQMQSQITQVRIEAKIAEVNQGAMKELGIRWFVQGEEGGGGFYPPMTQDTRIVGLSGAGGALANESIYGGSNNRGGAYGSDTREFVGGPDFDRRLNIPVQVPVAGQLFFGFLNDYVDIGALLDALVAENKAETLASPMILAVNHRKALIKMTDEYPYTEYGVQGYGQNFSTKFMDLGIKMDVTPHVYRDEGGVYVQLELEPEVSFYNGSANGIPIRAVRSSKSVANVRDGQTLVIGGIVLSDMRNTEQRLPVIGKMPVVGELFRHRERVKERKELMVFVTPAVHTSPESVTWDRMLDVSIADVPQGNIPTRGSQREARRE
ncbi:MAG TPA: polysaccharide biosynthesis/export family protein [Candidatus Hydrogenedentes bacterium]|nr:polysaccharide biosynthesis/export family protein [Candidatus Hydrogenedentota bacterium]HPG65935.1 polysaccharide biosynthesis/export family protein [Candidatus Hydrogenedentota bacterium]